MTAEVNSKALQKQALVAQFEGPDTLLRAVRLVRRERYRHLQAYSPFTIDELPDALGLPPTRLRVGMFVAGVSGAVIGLVMQYVSAVHAYPINSGGRPLASWPAFIPVAFELAVLFAAIFGFGALLTGAGLFELHHPAFDQRQLEAASDDGFFLVVSADDPEFETEATTRLLRSLGATMVTEWCQ